jgi:hypothetical protein
MLSCGSLVPSPTSIEVLVSLVSLICVSPVAVSAVLSTLLIEPLDGGWNSSQILAEGTASKVGTL